MSSNRKIKGYIFQRHDGTYYGGTNAREKATLYSMKELTAKIAEFNYWGRKTSGKWLIVFE